MHLACLISLKYPSTYCPLLSLSFAEMTSFLGGEPGVSGSDGMRWAWHFPFDLRSRVTFREECEASLRRSAARYSYNDLYLTSNLDSGTCSSISHAKTGLRSETAIKLDGQGS